MGSPVAPINKRVDFLLIGVVTLLRAGGEPLFFFPGKNGHPIQWHNRHALELPPTQ